MVCKIKFLIHFNFKDYVVGFSLILKELLDQLYENGITFPFVESASQQPSSTITVASNGTISSTNVIDDETFKEDDNAMRTLKHANVFVANGNFILIVKVFYRVIVYDKDDLFPRTEIKQKEIPFTYENEPVKKQSNSQQNSNSMDEDEIESSDSESSTSSTTTTTTTEDATQNVGK